LGAEIKAPSSLQNPNPVLIMLPPHIRKLILGSECAEGLGQQFDSYAVISADVPWRITRDRLGKPPQEVHLINSVDFEPVDTLADSLTPKVSESSVGTAVVSGSRILGSGRTGSFGGHWRHRALKTWLKGWKRRRLGVHYGPAGRSKRKFQVSLKSQAERFPYCKGR
jgi:hypothetical protein